MQLEPEVMRVIVNLVQLLIAGLIAFTVREVRALAKEVQIVKSRQYRQAVYMAAKFGDELPDYFKEG